MESSRNIAYIVFVAVAIVLLVLVFWYRRRRVRRILRERAAIEQEEYEQFTAAMARDNTGQWDNMPLHPQQVHLAYDPYSRQPPVKREYLPPYQPPPPASAPLSTSEPPPYPGAAFPSNNNNTLASPSQAFTRRESE